MWLLFFHTNSLEWFDTIHKNSLKHKLIFICFPFTQAQQDHWSQFIWRYLSGRFLYWNPAVYIPYLSESLKKSQGSTPSGNAICFSSQMGSKAVILWSDGEVCATCLCAPKQLIRNEKLITVSWWQSGWDVRWVEFSLCWLYREPALPVWAAQPSSWCEVGWITN